MDEIEIAERAAIVAAAKTWVGTPYRGNADVKGAGVDCGMLLVRVYVDTGFVAPFDPRPYPMQWAMHQREERFLKIVESYAHEIDGPPSPGDIALWRFALGWAHGSIVVEWPLIVHANPPGECRYDDAKRNSELVRRPVKFFSIWPRVRT